MIPKLYEDARYDDVPPTIRAMFDRIRDSRKGIYIHGDVGTGKTHIAYAMKTHWDIDHDRKAMFWNAPNLLREIRADFDRLPGERLHVEEEIMAWRGLLFIDDIGSEKVTEWVAETLYMIINERYVEKRPVIFTSNLPIGDLAEKIGDRSASRIVEMCEIVELQGEDRRINKQSKVTIKI